MITLKQKVQTALSSVGAAVYGYPRNIASLPLLSWRESENRRHAQADGREHLAELNYTLEIFASDCEAANGLLERVDAALCGMGFRRESSAEQFEADPSVAHITARYRALADAQGNIYQ